MIFVCKDCISDDIVQDIFEYKDGEWCCEVCKRYSPYCHRALETKEYSQRCREERDRPKVGVKLVLDGRDEFIADIKAVEKQLKKIQKQIETIGFTVPTTVNISGVELDDFEEKVLYIMSRCLDGSRK